jgi:hypothetical protein
LRRIEVYLLLFHIQGALLDSYIMFQRMADAFAESPLLMLRSTLHLRESKENQYH